MVLFEKKAIRAGEILVKWDSPLLLVRVKLVAGLWGQWENY